MLPQELLSRLRAYALQINNPTVELASFLRTLSAEVADPKDIETGVRELSFKGEFSLSADEGRLRAVTFPDFALMALAEEYRRLVVDPALPFPREETLPVPLPEGELMSLDAKGALGALLDPGNENAPGAAKLFFPERAPSLIVPRCSAAGDLVEAAVVRISRFLRDPKNAAYVESKLTVALRGNEVMVRESLDDIAVRPHKASATVITPTDFTFRFWSQLSGIIVQDVGAKADLSEAEKGVLQSAYIVAYASFHQKGAAQREQEKAADRKGLEEQVRKAPFIFGYDDMNIMKDDKGVALSVKHGRDFITSFLKDMTMVGEEETLPFLVRLHAAALKKDFFVHRDLLAPVFLSKLGEAAEELHDGYVKEWSDQMRDDRVPPASRTDPQFRKDVDQKIREEFPVLSALANGPLLYAAAASPTLGEEAKADLMRCFAREGSLKPMVALLGLSRTKLIRDARSFLPFWQTAPLIGGIVRFIRRLLRSRAAAEEESFSPAAAARAAAADLAPPTAEAARSSERRDAERLRKAVEALIDVYVSPDRTIDGVLNELSEEWNPLLDPARKRQLVLDVNALVQDYLHPIRNSLLMRPPDLKRIRSLAEQLAGSRSLSKIKSREPLLRYISLFMLRSLLGRKT